MTKSNIVDIDVIVRRQTEKAVFVALDEGSQGIWLPRSLIEIDTGEAYGQPAVVTLPEWLAQKEGLI